MIKYLLIPLLILSHCCTAQNLVPNGGFEERTGCPQQFDDLEGICLDWHSYAGSCDYFNTCSSDFGNYNPVGYQQPHSGNGYAGLILYKRNFANLREHLACVLQAPLTVGQTYYISFFVNNSWSPASFNIACNRIGFRLTTYAYALPSGIFDQLPNFSVFGEPEIISDTVAWTQIHQTFVADSAYTHLVLGNFYDDNNTDTLNQPNIILPGQAYYYIDDVCLSSDSTLCPIITSVTENKIENDEILFYPNPARDAITIKPISGFKTFEITDETGRSLMRGSLKEMKQEIPITSLSNGIYFLKFYAPGQIKILKLIKS